MQPQTHKHTHACSHAFVLLMRFALKDLDAAVATWFELAQKQAPPCGAHAKPPPLLCALLPPSVAHMCACTVAEGGGYGHSFVLTALSGASRCSSSMLALWCMLENKSCEAQQQQQQQQQHSVVLRACHELKADEKIDAIDMVSIGFHVCTNLLLSQCAVYCCCCLLCLSHTPPPFHTAKFALCFARYQ